MSFARMQKLTVAISVAALFGVAVIESAIPGAAQDASSLEQLLTKEEQGKLGVASMAPEKRDAMRGALIRMFRQGQRAGQEAERSGGVPARAGLVKTQADGEFIGWKARR